MSNLINKIIEKLKKFKKFIKGKSTFVIYSTNPQKKSFFKTISYRAILFVFVVFILLSVSSVHFLITKNNRSSELSQIQTENQTETARLEKLNRQINKINRYQDSYQQEINQIFNNFGNLDDETLWNNEFISGDELKLEFPLVDEVTINKNILQLNENRINLIVSLKHLEDISKYIDLRNELLDDIPIGWPIAQNRGYKTSDYGPRISPFTEKKEFHTGIDIAARQGSYILAMANGTVYYAGDKSSFGKVIMIQHKYGYRTVYSHNYENLVQIGDKVKKFQKIGAIGMTGRATGPHLHYEIRIGRQHVNPWDYLISKF